MDPIFDADELLVLARHDLQKGQIEGAMAKLKLAQQRPDCTPDVGLELARLYAQLGLRSRAILLFQSYLRQNPVDVDARFQLGMALFESGERESALPIWEEVLAGSPQYPPALYFRALAISQQGGTDQARSLLRGALDVLPADNLYFTRSRDLLTLLETADPARDALSRLQH